MCPKSFRGFRETGPWLGLVMCHFDNWKHLQGEVLCSQAICRVELNRIQSIVLPPLSPDHAKGPVSDNSRIRVQLRDQGECLALNLIRHSSGSCYPSLPLVPICAPDWSDLLKNNLRRIQQRNLTDSRAPTIIRKPLKKVKIKTQNTWWGAPAGMKTESPKHWQMAQPSTPYSFFSRCLMSWSR